MTNRLQKLREKMKEKGLDAVLINKPENQRYFSGLSSIEGYLIVTGDKAVLITDSRYTEYARTQSVFKVVEIKKSYIETLKETLDNLNITNLGFEDDFVTYSDNKRFTEKLEKNMEPLEGMLETFRETKDETEFKSLRNACALGDRGFSYILDFVKPGVSEKELAAELEYFLKKNGAEALSFDTIVASGARTSLPHAVPGERKVEYGDFVLFDFGCKVDGYCSDMTRTVVVGQANDEQKKIYNIVLEAQKRALDYIGNEKKCSDVDKVARDYIAQNGYGEKFGHSLGHSVGLYIHENPTLSTKSEKILKSGMVVTVEPGIYIEGFGGVRIEDMVIIKDDGVENLMKSPKELIIV